MQNTVKTKLPRSFKRRQHETLKRTKEENSASQQGNFFLRRLKKKREKIYIKGGLILLLHTKSIESLKNKRSKNN